MEERRKDPYREAREKTGHPDPVSFERVGAEPKGIYVSTDDKLLLRMRTNTPGNVVLVRGLIQASGRQVIPFEQLVTTTPGDRTVQQTFIGLTEGFLQQVTISHGSFIAPYGSTWVSVVVSRGNPADPQHNAVLLQGVVTAARNLGWPDGPQLSGLETAGQVRSVAGTDPAAGAEVSETVPTGAYWDLLGFRATLVTSAVAGARRVHVVIDDGAAILLDLAAADTQAASLTRNYNAGQDGFARAAQDSEIYVPLPAAIRLAPGFRVRTTTTLLDAGDNYSAPQLLVREYIDT